MLQHYMNNQFAAVNYQKLSSAAYVLSVFIIVLVLLIYRLHNKNVDSLQGGG
jgi:multiple sugar transport system permease protein